MRENDIKIIRHLIEDLEDNRLIWVDIFGKNKSLKFTTNVIKSLKRLLCQAQVDLSVKPFNYNMPVRIVQNETEFFVQRQKETTTWYGAKRIVWQYYTKKQSWSVNKKAAYSFSLLGHGINFLNELVEDESKTNEIVWSSEYYELV